MFLWFMRYRPSDSEWGAYVIAPTRNIAKALFHEYWKWDGDYIDVRGRKVKAADGYPEGVYDTDCEVLAELDVHYMTQEEWDKLWEELWEKEGVE